jgi:hypothetical protein
VTKDIEKALELRKYGVPYHILEKHFGHNHQWWYTLEMSFSHYSIVETTAKTKSIPQHLLADEHHEWIKGEKCYIATTTAEGCVFGCELSQSADKEDLTKAYQVFKDEALCADSDYKPQTVNTDGWKGTIGAWQLLFTSITLIRCFLHSWLPIRDRSKKLKENFFELGRLVWSVYQAESVELQKERLLELLNWSITNTSGVILDKIVSLCNRSGEWALHYSHPGCYRTSNGLDRLMRRQRKYFDTGQHFHGDIESGNRRCRAWAILYNYWDWSPPAIRNNDGIRCPAERFNGKRYADSWLQNLLVAAKMKNHKI